MGEQQQQHHIHFNRPYTWGNSKFSYELTLSKKGKLRLKCLNGGVFINNPSIIINHLFHAVTWQNFRYL